MRTGERVAGRFLLIDEIARGGMGTVYRAADTTTGRAVAIKVIRPTAELDDAIRSGRFAREVEVLAALSDPHVVRYVAHGTTRDGRPFLCQDWIDGVSLARRLEDGLAAADAVAIAAAIAAGLAAVHRAGIVHRDLKPSNVLLAGGDPARATLIDFGIARRDDDLALTRTGAAVGTPGYMSPEQARGDRAVDARSDVFGLGCVLYECLTGRPAFPGHGLLAVRSKILLYTPPRADEVAPGVARALGDTVARMLARAPADRYRDGAEVAAALAAVASIPAAGTTAPPEVARPHAPDPEASPACLAIAALAAGAPPLDEVRARLEPGDRVDAIGASLALISAPPALAPAEQLARCARAALALAPRLGGPIVLTALARRADSGDTIDTGIALLAARLAAAPAEPAVWCDAALAPALAAAGFALDGLRVRACHPFG